HVAGNETVNQWVEPFNGDKWRPAPYAPDTKLQKFKGYQITNDVQAQPTGVYSFKGTLCVCDAFLNLTRTSGVNYSGANLIGNSYTGAIDIKQGIVFPPEVEQTVYLFNTGTRDQWRKLNGSTVSGYRAGQYLSVPKNTAGQDNLPDRIPSMHSFLVKMQNGASCTLQILYDKLLKNTTVNNGNGTQITWRSGNSGSANMPSLVMDVLGNESADRLWIFTDGGLSFGFDNGWDGRKLTEKGLSQLYAMSDIGNDKFQVAGVPELNNLLIGFDADKDGQYTLEFALSDHFAKGAVYLHDLQSGAKHRITNSTSYSFDAKRGDSGARFRLSYGCDENVDDSHVVSTNGREIIILNQDALDCTVTLFTIEGKLLRRLKVLAGHREVMKVQTGGAYIVHLQNAFTNDVHKVLVEY
ncbi:minor fimbrial subunit Mfa5, partial [Porphyromonas gingivalis]|nr:minor fimbrial subunit Mfa5 [Porphyromonas gingivalis]MCE8192458.1 minor fimbrial subunit Mfa5 [Porphyromonas gingivalis]